MGRKCSVCQHQQLSEIDQAIVNGRSFRDIALQFHISHMAVARHARKHLPATLVEAHAARQVTHADDLLEQVRQLKDKALSILESAEEAGKHGAALTGIREVRGCIELLGKLEGQLSEKLVVDLRLSNEWIDIRGKVFAALGPFPIARVAVAKALAGKVVEFVEVEAIAEEAGKVTNDS